MSTSYNILEDKELFEYLGRALHVCQLLEVNLAYIIRDLHLLTDKIQRNDLLEYLQELQRVIDSRSKRTLGKLFQEIRKLVKLNDESERLLNEAVEKRNEIVHRFFYKHCDAMIDPDCRDAVLDDLKQSIRIISAAYELSQKIHSELRAQIKSDTDNADEAY